jgi:hypothetical protein
MTETPPIRFKITTLCSTLAIGVPMIFSNISMLKEFNLKISGKKRQKEHASSGRFWKFQTRKTGIKTIRMKSDIGWHIPSDKKRIGRGNAPPIFSGSALMAVSQGLASVLIL